MRAAQILGADRLILDLQDRLIADSIAIRLRIADLIRTHCHELLTQWPCAGEHPAFDGTTYIFYVIQEEVAGIWGASVLSDPKQVAWQADGTVKVIEHLPDNVARRTLFTQHAGCAGWVAQPAPWQTQDNTEFQFKADDLAFRSTSPLCAASFNPCQVEARYGDVPCVGHALQHTVFIDTQDRTARRNG